MFNVAFQIEFTTHDKPHFEPTVGIPFGGGLSVFVKMVFTKPLKRVTSRLATSMLLFSNGSLTQGQNFLQLDSYDLAADEYETGNIKVGLIFYLFEYISLLVLTCVFNVKSAATKCFMSYTTHL